MPKIKSSFSLKSKAPNFERDSFLTKKAMREISPGYVDEGHISYCLETGKHYKFSTYHNFSQETGYFKVFETDTDLSGVYKSIEELEGKINSVPDDVMDTLKNLTDKVNELYAKEFPISCTLSSTKGTILLYDSTVDSVELELKINIKYKNASLPRERVKELSITSNVQGALIGTYDTTSEYVKIVIPQSYNKSYTFTLNIVTDDGQTPKSTCTIHQRANCHIGYSKRNEPNISILTKDDMYVNIKTVLTTSLEGYKEKISFPKSEGDLPIGSYLWVICPPGVTIPKKVYGNGFEASMISEIDGKKIEIKDEDNGITYTCLRSTAATNIVSFDMNITFVKT